MSFTHIYAPTHLDDVVLASITLKSKLADYVNGRLLQPLVLYRDFGTGKTSIATLLPDAIEGKPAQVTTLRSTSFSSVDDVVKEFGGPPMFYKLFTTNDQKRTYVVSNEINFTPKAAIAFRDIMDDMVSHTQFIFTTNYIDQLDAGLRDRSLCLKVPSVTAKDWLRRAQWILGQEGIAVPDEHVLKILSTQLQISSSNRKVLERLEDFVRSVRSPPASTGGNTVAGELDPQPNPNLSPLIAA